MRGIYRLDVAMRCCQRTDIPGKAMPFGLPISPQAERYLGVSHSGTVLSRNGLQIPAPNSDYNLIRRLIRDVDSASLKFSKSSMYMSRVERISRDSVSLAEMGKRVR
jgi:hypothetical protein